MSLDIILTPDKIPEKIAPIHIVELISEEIGKILFLSGSSVRSSRPAFVGGSHAIIPHS